MYGYIDELSIEAKDVAQETEDFYTVLGLRVERTGKAVRIFSTKTTRIKSYINELKLSVSWDHYSELMEKKVISEEGGGECILEDNTGTKVVVMPRKIRKELRLGVLTSGGDSPGMNSAVRSIVRYSLKNEIQVFGIYRGFEGLIRGDIRRLGWDSETHRSGQSGTYLLSARSERFKTREGRKEAAFNLAIRNIVALIVIGGEGSMEGALTLKAEFEELCTELIAEGRLKQRSIDEVRKKRVRSKEANEANASPNGSVESTEKVRDVLPGYCDSEPEDSDEFAPGIDEPYSIQIIGVPGTIDNDIAGTDHTLGCNTAITRVSEAVEKLISTMKSHKRVFVVECMGRNCGWITLMSGFAVEAEYIFIPEAPCVNWKDEMVRTLKTAYFNHKLNIFVFVSEKALDGNGHRIKTKEIEETIRDAGMDVRSLVVGHLQRGGMTTSRDRFLGTMFGMRAVEFVMGGSTDPVMVGHVDNEFKFVNLHEIVEMSKELKRCFKKRDYEKIMKMRDPLFQDIFKMYEHCRLNLMKRYFTEQLHLREFPVGHLHAHKEKKLNNSSLVSARITKMLETKSKLRLGILMEGQSAGGMNTVLNSVIQFGLSEGAEVFYFLNGYNGITDINARKADVFEFSLLHNQGGAIIGTSNAEEADFVKIVEGIDNLNLDYLIVIGGTKNLGLARLSSKVLIIPAATSNNFPGTSMSIGSETALNSILVVTEACRLTALSTRRTLFMIEVGGVNCGFLSVIGAIACAAFEAIYPESSNLEDLILIKKRIRGALARDEKTSVVIFRNENTFERMSTENLCKMICSGENVKYSYSILGHLERGISPSVLDKIYARISAFKAVETCVQRLEGGVIGISNDRASLVPIDVVMERYDEEKDTGRDMEWLKYTKVISLIE